MQRTQSAGVLILPAGYLPSGRASSCVAVLSFAAFRYRPLGLRRALLEREQVQEGQAHERRVGWMVVVAR